MKKVLKKALFLELAKPDETGASRRVYPKEFKGKYESLFYRNGNPWKRSITGYDVYVHKENNKTKYIKLNGFKKHTYNSGISSSIKKEILKKRCVILHTKSNVECDHKDGFKAFDISRQNQKEKDFQPMHKSVNNAKREHCKKCKSNKKRFDAKKLGYQISYWDGSSRYEGSCVGCYWHDPKRFNKESGNNPRR